MELVGGHKLVLVDSHKDALNDIFVRCQHFDVVGLTMVWLPTRSRFGWLGDVKDTVRLPVAICFPY